MLSLNTCLWTSYLSCHWTMPVSMLYFPQWCIFSISELSSSVILFYQYHLFSLRQHTELTTTTKKVTSWGLNFLQIKWKQRWLPSLLTSKPWRKLWLKFRPPNVRPLLITSQYTINISLKFDKKFHIISKHFIKSTFLSKVAHCHLEKIQVILQNMKARYTLWSPIVAKLFVPTSLPS